MPPHQCVPTTNYDMQITGKIRRSSTARLLISTKNRCRPRPAEGLRPNLIAGQTAKCRLIERGAIVYPKACEISAFVFVLFVSTTASLAGKPASFEKAYHKAKDTKRPLIVVIGATWCQSCVQLKDGIIPKLQERGDFDEVELTLIDIDRQKVLAEKLLRGRSRIPQIVRMDWNGETWDIRRLSPKDTNPESLSSLAGNVNTKSDSKAVSPTNIGNKTIHVRRKANSTSPSSF